MAKKPRPPKRKTFRAACRKKGFSKLAHAQAALDSMLRGGAPEGSLHIYRCPICTNRYHLGHDKDWRNDA